MSNMGREIGRWGKEEEEEEKERLRWGRVAGEAKQLNVLCNEREIEV